MGLHTWFIIIIIIIIIILFLPSELLELLVLRGANCKYVTHLAIIVWGVEKKLFKPLKANKVKLIKNKCC